MRLNNNHKDFLLDKSAVKSIIIEEFRLSMGGLNTEIKHKGLTLIVQTQDKGLKAQYVESLVYSFGKVLVSRKTFYTSFLNSPDLKIKISEIIRNQHQKIIEDISQGKFDHILKPEPTPNAT